MKTAIHNTQTNTTTIRDIPKWQPLNEHQILLHVIRNDRPLINPATHRAVDDWQLDLVAKTYTQVWTITPLTDYEIAMRDWIHPDYQFRIVAPTQLAFTDDGPKLKAWFDLNELPIQILQNEMINVYCNTILHPELLEKYQDFIQIEHRPIQTI